MPSELNALGNAFGECFCAKICTKIKYDNTSMSQSCSIGINRLNFVDGMSLTLWKPQQL